MNNATYEERYPAKSFWKSFVPSWLVGIVGAYFLASFLSNFYNSFYQFVLLCLIFQPLCGMIAFVFLSDALESLKMDWQREWPGILTFGLASFFAVRAVTISWQFPSLFDRRILFMDSSMIPLFAGLSLVSIVSLVFILKAMDRNKIRESLQSTRFFRFLQDNLPGILLAASFFFTYFIFAQSINFPGFNTLDQYFDSDISEWLARLAASHLPLDVRGVRAVHPAVLIFLRSLIWFVSIFLNGDRLHAVFLANALAGGTCVLLTWLIIRRASGNSAYALILASVLGASASHLLLSSIIETYIYSALALILFVFVIQGEDRALRYTVPTGVLVFGITVTNIVQTCILYSLMHPRVKVILKYIFIVVLVTLTLNVLQVWIYPTAKLSFVPANLLSEQKYEFGLTSLSWRTMGRLYLTVRAILLYGVVAPKPFILTKEIGTLVPNFRTYQITIGEFHVAGYDGLADFTVKFWIVIVAAAGILFILNLFKSPRQAIFPLALSLCLGFNLALHMAYGDDPMLYSPDWVYAVVLFVAFSLLRWADRKWLQAVLLILLALMMISNLRLIHQIMEVSLPFYGH